ncbi:hypothetical protein L5515_012457 [Caenorhabditis briggsae]|uniref:RRM domain-containing protein n=1 Tax=Caenorhabditis briggsae TaxID=6238 RepID=A0AAE9EYP4_CAEBR|nr:hypothetical protein L5515_012457 [Caenorhabditis briggsae]
MLSPPTSINFTNFIQHRKLFIGGLNMDTNKEQLREYFTQFGPVVDTVVMKDNATQRSRGFGFVTFAWIASAEMAIRNGPHKINGRMVELKRSIPKEQMSNNDEQSSSSSSTNQKSSLPKFPPPNPGSKLALHQIQCSIHTVDSLRSYFESFGIVEQIEITPRADGFVVFEEKASADRCLAHGAQHDVQDHKIWMERQEN